MFKVKIRPYDGKQDSVEQLTLLIHSAYAHHAENGLKFWATHQSVEDTVKRLAKGSPFVAEVGDVVVGTITLLGPQADSTVEVYRSKDTCTFIQFAVLPEYKGRGIGRALHDHAIHTAILRGASRCVIDTAAPATHLIQMYEAWGYTVCGECDWRPFTNYMSTLLSLPLK